MHTDTIVILTVVVFALVAAAFGIGIAVGDHNRKKMEQTDGRQAEKARRPEDQTPTARR
jgi:hypothetical protein